MKFQYIKSITSSLAVMLIISLSSCVKDKFDAPANVAATNPAGLNATMTINQFKAHYLPNNVYHNMYTPIQITDDVILSGVINSDDRSGNFYKQLIFQDASGGMQIAVDGTALYNNYPIGTRIFVKCKGLYLYNYLGTIELGGYIKYDAQPSLGSIPLTNLSKYVIKGANEGSPTPIKHTIPTLLNADPILAQSTLIQMDSMEFSSIDTSKAYADAINKVSGNLNLQDCNGNPSVQVRSSGYADFATKHAAQGKGTITGIFTIYIKTNGTLINQIAIRNIADVQFNNTNRCP